MLIVDAEIDGVAGCAVRCRDGLIEEVGRGLQRRPDEPRVDANGGVLLPGLHDHHIHLLALAATSRSVRCGPPEVRTREQLQRAVRNVPGNGWIRGVGYHESVAGMLDRKALDCMEATRPTRIQHRSGKMWFLNSAAIQELRVESTDGRLFRADTHLHEASESLAANAEIRAGVEETSRRLASFGVTGLTETTPHNDPSTLAFYQGLNLHQRLNCMGDESLAEGSLKIMLDDAQLPTYEALRTRIANAHERGRPIAIHCVTRTELVFALAILADAGTMRGDRIEHASVADEAALDLFKRVRGERDHLTVVTQPNFVAERGDRYLRDVPSADQPNLYRCRAFLNADIPLGGGTDAPFGGADPWAAMRAAVHRRTETAEVLGEAETLTPEQALALFTTPLDAPGGSPRRLALGAAADFCLLKFPWHVARTRLRSEDVALTVRNGQVQWRAPRHHNLERANGSPACSQT